MVKSTASTAAKLKLEEIQQETLVICEPRYHEFHRNVETFGFSKITIAKKRP